MIDAHLELLNWFPQTGPTIAPCAPASYGMDVVPGKHPSLLLQSSGSADPTGKLYPGVLFCPGTGGTAAPRPIPPNTGNVTLAYSVWVDGLLRNLETDLLIVQNGLKFNLSLERNVTTGEIDIGGWTDTGLRLGLLTSNERHWVKIACTFTATDCTVVSYACDGVKGIIPAKFAKLPATPCNWLPGAYIQLQLAMFPGGAASAARFRNINLIWS